MAVRRRRTFVRAIDLSTVPSLHWWRHLPADAYTGAHLDILRKAISGIIIMNEPRWPDAVRGDPAAAIGVALRTAKQHSTPSPAVDLVMSAVLLTALAGDPASRLMLTTMIARHSAEKEKSRLAASWFSRNQDTGRAVVATAESSGSHISHRKTAGA